MSSHKIDWPATNHRAVQVLKDALCPEHYRTLFEEAVVWNPTEHFSEKTDPVEKFRQHYAERDHPPIRLIPNTGGYLGLEHWFQNRHIGQLSLWAPPGVGIEADRTATFEAGMELAKREPHMIAHFHDADTPYRKERRKKAALVEIDVRMYLRNLYPDFYRPPSNEGQYKRPAPDDFSLVLPNYRKPMVFDVKSDSYINDEGQMVAVVRNVKDDIHYLFASWHDEEYTQLHGILSGKRVSARGENNGKLIHVAYNKTFPIDSLLVMLNMAKNGLHYDTFYLNFNNN